MRKLYSLVAFAVMSMMSLTASAATYDLPEENGVLQSGTYNMRLYKTYDFVGWTVNGVEITPTELSFGDANTEIPTMNTYNPLPVLNEGLANVYFQMSGTNTIVASPNDYGLRNTGSGPRWFGFGSMKAGQILVVQTTSGGYYYNDEAGTTDENGANNQWFIVNAHKYNVSGDWAMHFYAEYEMDNQVEDITAEVHEAQDADLAEGEESVADGFRYVRVLNDGFVYFMVGRAASVQGVQIWIDNAAAEAVSSPSLKVVGVNGDSRRLEFKAGESTLGSNVSTYYSLNGDDPIFLKDSEEIDHYDYIYEEDEEGNQVVVDSTAVYKRVLDTDLVAEVGDYGDIMYNPEDGYIDVYASEDEDGDGIVVVKAASVSETGAVSDVVTVNVAIGEITLNAPTLELQGFSGLDRLYAIKWVNNTICDEEFSITYEGDGGALYGEAVIDDVIAVKNDVTVTVKVEGYADGVGTYEADAPGIDIHRKAAVTEDGEGNAIHDWDFVNLTAEQQAIIKGEVVESCYIIAENGDSLVYTAAEYEEGVAADGTDLSGAIANYAASCWWWDGSRSRATLNVASDTIVDPATIHDLNDNGYGYVEDFAHVYDGFTISCPPNASNNSCLFIYINGDLGAYFMAQPTFTFPRESVAAGEYLLVYQGQGGSNYTNSRWPTIYEAATGELLSFSLARNGIHVFYMDVYTYDNLPADEYDPNAEPIEDAIQNVKPAGIQKIVGYYSVNGAKLAAPQKGINIVKYADGASAKILVK